MIKTIADSSLFGACLFILLGSVFITFKMRFVQLRFFPALLRTLKASFLNKKQGKDNFTIPPHKALLTAMSTTLGISTIVGPVIAIQLGGPGALLGFLLTSFFGSAATFAEVTLCIQHRKRLDTGEIMGGPMQYLRQLLSPAAAKWYAVCCLILMTAWSGAQANQLAAILDSRLLGNFRVPTMVSGALAAIFTIIVLMGGIKRVGSLSSKLVPIMFVFYLGACFAILLINLDKLGGAFVEMFRSALSPYPLASGTLVGGLVSALRWGVFKGTQASEAGIGTQAIPHSMSDTKDPMLQATLSMLSTYMAGFVSFVSGCVTLVTKTWLSPDLPLGISMVAESFRLYFSVFGIIIVAISTILFGFGTILGNSFNGSQCFAYLTKNRGVKYYFFLMGVMIFIGAIAEVKTFWSFIDLILASMAVPHMAALIIYAHKKPKTAEGFNLALQKE